MTDLEQSVHIGVSADRAWDWIATGPGLSAWFVAADVQPGPAGSVTLTFAPGASGTMPITAWQPPSRFRFGAAAGESGRAHDFTITPNHRGCDVHLRDIDVPDGEAEPTAAGWRTMLGRLAALAEEQPAPAGGP